MLIIILSKNIIYITLFLVRIFYASLKFANPLFPRGGGSLLYTCNTQSKNFSFSIIYTFSVLFILYFTIAINNHLCKFLSELSHFLLLLSLTGTEHTRFKLFKSLQLKKKILQCYSIEINNVNRPYSANHPHPPFFMNYCPSFSFLKLFILFYFFNVSYM